MSRRNKFLIWLTSFLGLLGLAYASLPWVISALIKYNLSSRGGSDIQINVDYPGWQGLRLHALDFTLISGEYKSHVQVPKVNVTYHLTDLITGNIAQIRVPVVSVDIKSSLGSTATKSSSAELPMATLLSGQWLSQLPVNEVLLEQLTADMRIATEAVYSLRLSGELRDRQLQVNGDILIPKPAQRPIVFSINTQPSGEMRLLVSSIDQTATPMLTVTVKPFSQDEDQDQLKPDQINLNGTLTAQLDNLQPILMPYLSRTQWLPTFEGYLNSQWQAQVSGVDWQIMGEASVQNLSGRWREQMLPHSKWNAKFDVNSQRARLQTTLSTGQKAVVLETKAVHQFARGHGHANVTLKAVEFSDKGFVLSGLLKNWPYPFDINAGRVSASGRFRWQQAFNAQIDLKLDKLDGNYDQLAFAGLSAELALDNGEGLHTNKDAILSLDLVDVGFPVEKVEVGFALVAQAKTPIPIVRVKSFSAELLGGRALSGPFEFDFVRDKNSLIVQLEQIGLNDIMKLEQQEGLQGSGRLNGQIPLQISKAGIVVTQGQLSAVAPGGEIRYTPTPKVAAMAKSNASLDTMLKALSNFQYQVLDISSDYKLNGDLVLKVRLQGKNPDWQAGRPINLNLNLQENIPTLLRSLQLSDEVSEQVRKRYQNKQK